MLALFQYLKSYYNKKFEIPGREKKQDMMVNTWLNFLGDYPFQVVKVATKNLMIKKEWSPTPGEIIQEINNMQADDEDRLTAGEAWEKVIEAISKHGYTYNPGKVKEELSPKVLHAAEVTGLDLISRKGNDSYVMNLFIKNYNSIKERDEELEKLPHNMRKETKKLADKFKGTPKLEEGNKEGDNGD